MNDELQKALAEFVKVTLAGFQQGKDFVLAQAPEVIQQLIRWKFWEAAAYVGIGLAIVAVCVYVMYRCAKFAITDGFEQGWPFFGLVLAVPIGIQCSIVFKNALVMLQIWLAPKVWLLEWAMAQVKK